MSGAPWTRQPSEKTEDGSGMAAQIGLAMSDVVEAGLRFSNLLVSDPNMRRYDMFNHPARTASVLNSGLPFTNPFVVITDERQYLNTEPTMRSYDMFNHQAQAASVLTSGLRFTNQFVGNRGEERQYQNSEPTMSSYHMYHHQATASELNSGLHSTNPFLSSRGEERQYQNSEPTMKDYDMFNHQATASESATLETLNRILPRIWIQTNKTFERNRIMDVIRDINKGLRDINTLFKEMYQDILWTTRYHEGFNICEADEFELYIILALPVTYSDLSLTTKEACSGYVCIKNFAKALRNMRPNKKSSNIYSEMIDWCDFKGDLSQDRVCYWLMTLLDFYISKNKEKIVRNFGLGNVSLVLTGTTSRVLFEMAGKKEIRVDMVPAIEFKAEASRHTISPPTPFRKLPYINSWYAVPKPQDLLYRSDLYNVWRLSFCLHEEALMKVVGILKPAISLIKKLRDTQQWYPIQNYFIKTVALWEIHDPHNRHLITFMPLDKVFFHLLEKLHEKVLSKTLISYWDPRHNLLEGGIVYLRQQDIANRMRLVIDTLKRDPKMIERYIMP